MTRIGGRGGAGGDPAALDRAAENLEDVARRCRNTRGRLESRASDINPMSEQTRETIGGTASGKDREMAQHLTAVVSRLKTAVGLLARAEKEANDLAAQARAQAKQARAKAARQQPEGRRR